MKDFIRLLITALLLLECQAVFAGPQTLTLTRRWLIQTSDRVPAGGREVSTAAYYPTNWYRASVPSTVLGSLVDDGVFKDVFRGRNLDKIPDSMFIHPWWYRTTFRLPAKSPASKTVILRFLGINYKADIWLNGNLVADTGSVEGGFRQFEFDVTRFVSFGGMNVLAVRVYRPGPAAVTLGFVDWNPRPADHDMGLWRPVEVHVCGDVAISNPFVATEVDTATLKKAKLTISAELTNYSNGIVSGNLKGKIGRVTFSQLVTLKPGESKDVSFVPSVYRQLVFKNPKLWWTHDFGKPNLYTLHLDFKTNDRIADVIETKFGIRQINEYKTRSGFKGFKLNGKKILIRGGGWADDIFLRSDENRLKSQINYAVNMHLNAIRCEGFWGEGDDMYRLCDEKGLLVMVGWSALWEWKPYFGGDVDEYGGIKTPEEMRLAAESFRDEVIWLRNHPSIFVWVYGSDKTPRPELEKKYLSMLAKYDSTRPSLASAAEHVSELTGPTAVKMRGPYDYVPPDYWFADTSNGGAFGFNTETGPGPQVPQAGSLKRMLSPDSLWPINGEWLFHCSRGAFGNLKRYNSAIDGRLGEPVSFTDYERKAQFTSYEAMRAMFESFGAMKFRSTGVIQWMYNTAWPKMWWQLYDYYLNPTGAFFGAQEACMPLHAVYDCYNNNVYVVNSTLTQAGNLKLEVRVLDLDLSSKYSEAVDINSPANSSIKALRLPSLDSLTPTYFLDLRLYHHGKMVDENFYALSTKEDMLDWKNSNWYVTPDTSYADLRGLNRLAEVNLSAGGKFVRTGRNYSVRVTLHNPTKNLAFMTYLSVRMSRTGEAVLPVYWNANYIALLPGETRTVDGRFESKYLHGQSPVIRVSGWNVKEMIIR